MAFSFRFCFDLGLATYRLEANGQFVPNEQLEIKTTILKRTSSKLKQLQFYEREHVNQAQEPEAKMVSQSLGLD